MMVNLLFAAALFVPLTPALFLALAVALSIIALAQADMRAEARAAIRAVIANAGLTAGVVALALGSAPNGFLLFPMAGLLHGCAPPLVLGRHDRADIVFAAGATIVLLFSLQYG